MAKEIHITIETDSLLILRGRPAIRAWCPLCEAEAEMIALKDTGIVSNLDREAVEVWLRSGALHRSQAADGPEVICLNSLLARVSNKKTS